MRVTLALKYELVELVCEPEYCSRLLLKSENKENQMKLN